MLGDKLTSLSSGSLLSGLHSYGGHPDHLKLRLLFTDHALLATRPRFRMNGQTNHNQTHDNGSPPSQTRNKQSPVGVVEPAAAATTTTTTTAAAATTTPAPTKPTTNFELSSNHLDNSFHSSYLLKKGRTGGWTIRPEVKSCPLGGSGLKLRVTSCSGGDGSVCSSCANIGCKDGSSYPNNSNAGISGGTGGSRKDSGNDSLTAINWPSSSSSRQQRQRRRQSNGTNKWKREELTSVSKSERAFNWKDTNVIVTSDKNRWKRTMARKLVPSEMANHIQRYHHHASTETPCGLWAALEGCFGSCDACLCLGGEGSLGSSGGGGGGKEMGAALSGCQLLTDWYQSQLLNGHIQGDGGNLLALDAARDDNLLLAATGVSIGDNSFTRNGARCEFDSYNDDSSGRLTNAKLDNSADSSNRDASILNERVSDATVSASASASASASTQDGKEKEENEIKGQRQPLADKFRPALGVAGPRCSHLEILYITMENHRQIGDSVAACEGESFALSPMTTSTEQIETPTTTSISTAKVTVSSGNTGDATVSARTEDMQRKLDMGDNCDSNCAYDDDDDNNEDDDDHHPRHQMRSDERNRYQDKDKANKNDDEHDKQPEQQQPQPQPQHVIETGGGGVADKFNCKGTTSTIIGGNSTTAMATNYYDDGDHKCSSDESSDKDDDIGEDQRQRQINHLKSDRLDDRWMLNEQLRQRGTLLNNGGSGAKICLAVIVIDKLNRLIQVKPDLDKLISVDICTELGICGLLAGVSNGGGHICTTRPADVTTNTSSPPTAAATATATAASAVSTATADATIDGRHHTGLATLNTGSSPRASRRVTQIQCNLLYQLEIVNENSRASGGSCCGLGAGLAGRSEARRQLNLLYGHLFSKPLESPGSSSNGHLASASDERGSRFINPADGGGMLIKLQFDIHFASDFPKDCRNLYVKYKLLAKLRGSSQWRLRRRYEPQQPLAAAATAAGSATKAAGGLRMKEEIWWQQQQQQLHKARSLATSVPHGGEKKLAQMSHSITSATAAPIDRPQQIVNIPLAIFANKANPGDEPKKPSAKSTLPAAPTIMTPEETTFRVDGTVDGGHEPPECKPPPSLVSENTPAHDRCLLEGSTITSEPDSRGRFHFACVEELVLELLASSSNNNHNKWHKPTHQSRPLVSSESLSKTQTDLSRQTEQKSNESTPKPSSSDHHGDKLAASESLPDAVTANQTAMDNDGLANQLGRVAKVFLKHPDTNGSTKIDPNQATTTPNSPGITNSSGDGVRSSSLSSAARDDENNQVVFNKQADSNGCANNYESAKTSQTQPSNNKSTTNTTHNNLDQAEVPRVSANDDDDDNCKNGARENGSGCGSHFRQANSGDNDNDDDGELEIVLLFEFYSSDFYRDKLQGWSHLSIPVDLETTRIDNNPAIAYPLEARASVALAQAQARPLKSNKDRPTDYVLPVIIPELCSVLDKLRYYLIGQLPAYVPPIESFATSNHRYLFLTKQSGKLVLSCELVRQFSYPNFDSNLMDLPETSKEHEKRRHHSGTDLDQILNHEKAICVDSVGSGYSNEEGNGLDTRGVVEAYRRAKHRIEELNLSSLLAN